MGTQVEPQLVDVEIELRGDVTEYDPAIIAAMLATDRIQDRAEWAEYLEQELPSALYEYLEGNPQDGIAQARAGRNHDGLPRLVLQADPTADDCAEALPWELIVRRRELGDRHTAIVRQVGQRAPRRPLPNRRRALIVIGDYSQAGEPAHTIVCSLLESLAVALQGFAEVVFATTMPTDTFGIEVRELPTPDALIAELATGYELVHFVGHSKFDTPEPGMALGRETAPKADRLGLIVGSSRMFKEVSAREIADALQKGAKTRLVVMDSCLAHRHFAGPVLESVEHFIGMNAIVPVQFGQLWSPTFYRELAKGRSVSNALRHARRAIREEREAEDYAHLDFVPCHWRATDDDHPFGNAAELPLCAYLDALRRHETGRINPILGQREDQVEHVELRFGSESKKAAHELINRSARWILLGDPGTGKTATLRHLAREFTAEPTDTGHQLVPVLVSLPDLTDTETHRSIEPILDHVSRSLGFEGSERARITAALQTPPDAYLLVFLIDGLDEASAKGDEVVRALIDHYPEHSILVASRENGRGLLDASLSFEPTRIQPLTHEQQLQLLAGALRAIPSRETVANPEARAQELLESLGQSFAELARLPLFLALFALLGHELKSSKNRRELLLNSIHTLLQQRHRQRPNDKDWSKGESALRLLEAIASDLTALGKRSANVSWLRRFLTFGGMQHADGAPQLTRLRKHLDTSSKCDIAVNYAQFSGGVDALLEELKQRGLLVHDDSDDAIWKFPHKSFQEVLASNVLNRMPQGMDRLLELLSEQLNPQDSREEADTAARRRTNMVATWAEPLAFWVATPEEDGARHERVRRMLAVHGDLALRAATYADVRDVALLQNVLAAASDTDKPLIDRLDALSTDNLCKTRTAVAELEQRLTPERLFDADDALAKLVERDTGNEGMLSLAAEEAQGAREAMWNRYQLDPRLWSRVPGREQLPLWSHIASGSTSDLQQPFWIMTVTVTRALFGLFEADGEAHDEHPGLPVIVRWKTARYFAQWLNHHREALFESLRSTGSISVQVSSEAWGVRLPTAAEWRHAASGGSDARYVNGIHVRDLERYAVFSPRTGNGPNGPSPVASKESSDNGLFDMQGNVLEWVADKLIRQHGIKREALGGSYKSLAKHCALDQSDEIADETSHKIDWQSRYPTGFRLVIAPID